MINKNITKFYNGKKLTEVGLRKLFDEKRDGQGYVYFLYRLHDKTNDYEYIGKKTAKTFKQFKDYVTCGSMAEHFIETKGIKNFSQYILGFYQDYDSLNLAESLLVTKNYLENANTYNLMIGGQTSWKNSSLIFHCPKTHRTFRGLVEAKNRVLELGFELGFSPTFLDSTKWTEERKTAVRKNRAVEMHYDDGEGKTIFLKIKNKDVPAYLNLGWKVKSSKLWMHIPGESIYKRGINYKQTNTHNLDNMLKFFDKGFIVGKPPKMEGCVFDENYKFNKLDVVA